MSLLENMTKSTQRRLATLVIASVLGLVIRWMLRPGPPPEVLGRGGQPLPSPDRPTGVWVAAIVLGVLTIAFIAYMSRRARKAELEERAEREMADARTAAAIRDAAEARRAAARAEAPPPAAPSPGQNSEGPPPAG